MRIIYFDIDSCRPDHLGGYGYGRATSPNLDRIARESTIFTNCYTSDSPCQPSRTSLHQGRFGVHNGVITHGGAGARLRFPPGGSSAHRDLLPLPMVFSRNGYRTASFSTFAQRHQAWYFYAGWDEIQKFNNKNGEETADDVNAALIPWLHAHGRVDKFYLHVNYWDPHTPYRTPLEYGNPFEGEPPPDWLTDEILAQHWQGCGATSAQDLFHAPARFPRMPQQIHTRADFKRWIDGYDVGVHYVDHHIGQVLNTLADLGVLDDTAIIVSADHGENLGELNVYGDHETADHFTCRVPLIVRWPGVTRPAQVDALMYQLDLAPTLCELIGAPVPGGWDGESFAPALRGETLAGRSHLVIGQGLWTCQRAVRWKSQIFIRTYHPGLGGHPDLMLFDLAADPHETTNLADSRPSAVAEGDHLLFDWLNRNLSGQNAAPDPMLATLEEGGPLLCRDRYEEYAERLRATGREAHAEDMIRRQETRPGLRLPAPWKMWR